MIKASQPKQCHIHLHYRTKFIAQNFTSPNPTKKKKHKKKIINFLGNDKNRHTKYCNKVYSSILKQLVCL